MYLPLVALYGNLIQKAGEPFTFIINNRSIMFNFTCYCVFCGLTEQSKHVPVIFSLMWIKWRKNDLWKTAQEQYRSVFWILNKIGCISVNTHFLHYNNSVAGVTLSKHTHLTQNCQQGLTGYAFWVELACWLTIHKIDSAWKLTEYTELLHFYFTAFKFSLLVLRQYLPIG